MDSETEAILAARVVLIRQGVAVGPVVDVHAVPFGFHEGRFA
jgi:hypothetical protein